MYEVFLVDVLDYICNQIDIAAAYIEIHAAGTPATQSS